MGKRLASLKRGQTAFYSHRTAWLSLSQPCVLSVHTLHRTYPQNSFHGTVCPKALIISTAEKGSNNNHPATHYTKAFRKQSNLGKIPGWSRGQGEKRQRKLMLGPLPGHCWQRDPATTVLLTRCSRLTSCSSWSGWQDWKGQRGKKKKKKIDFFVEENKYGDMERDPSVNRRGLRFDRAAGSQVAVSMPRN